MSTTTTMSIALPETMRAWIDQRVTTGQYGNTSEYLRDLIRRDQEEQAKQRLRALVEEGLASGPPAALTDGDIASIKKRIRRAAR